MIHHIETSNAQLQKKKLSVKKFVLVEIKN